MTISKSVMPNFDKEVKPFLVQEFKKMDGLYFTDTQAMNDAIFGFQQNLLGYMVGFMDAIDVLQYEFSSEQCNAYVKQADELIQQKQNKQQQ
jgi:hypothetical protein